MTTGATSATEPDARIGPATHTCELVERHSVSVPLGGNPLHAKGKAFLVMDRWHTEHDLEPVGPPSLKISDDGAALLVGWDITVGKGDIAPVTGTPGVADGWRWSARMHWWREVFNRNDRRQGRLIARREDGVASVTAIRRGVAEASVPPPLPPPLLSPLLPRLADPHRSTTGTGPPPVLLADDTYLVGEYPPLPPRSNT